MLLEELNILEEKVRHKSHLNNEDTLLLKKIQNITPMLQQGGMDVNAENIANAVGISKERAEHLLQLGTSRGSLSAETAASGNDPLQRVLLDYYAARQIFEKNKTAKKPTDKQPVPKGGLNNIVKRTGLTAEQITDVVNNRWDELVAKGSQLGFDIKPGYFALQDSALKKQYFDPNGSESRADAVRRAVGELTDNFSSKHYGTLSGEAIGKHIGIDRRTVDQLLSDEPSLQDLNKFRVYGKRPGLTDNDRAQQYINMNR